MKRRLRWPLAAAGLALVLACAPADDGLDLSAVAPRELTAGPGTETNPRVSPDGTTLAFEAVVDGEPGIYLMDLASSAVRRLPSTGTGEDRRPAWSPDGERIAFISNRTELWTVEATGGEPRRLLQGGASTLSAPDWSPDGTRIAASLTDPTGQPGNAGNGRATIITVDANDGTVTELTTGGDEWWPRWSADGEWLYYYVGMTDDLVAVHATTRELRPVGIDGFHGWRPAASRDGEHVAFVSDVAGFGIFLGSLREPNRPAGIVLSGEPSAPSFTPDGSALVFSRDTTSTHLVRLALSDGHRDTLATGRLPEPLAGGGVAYLPDGARRNYIVISRADRSDTLSLSLDHITTFTFSPDQRRLAVAAPAPWEAQHDVHLFDGDGTYVRRLTSNGDVWRGFAWCGDGRLVYATRGDRENNAFREIWVVDTETGEREQLTTSQGASKQPTQCDHGGSRITFRYPIHGDQMFTLDRETSQLTQLGSGAMGRWSPDGTRLVFVDRVAGQTDIFVLEPDGSRTRVTDDAAVEAEPRWVAGGGAVVFGVRRPNRGVWIVSLRE